MPEQQPETRLNYLVYCGFCKTGVNAWVNEETKRIECPTCGENIGITIEEVKLYNEKG